jgi:acyl-CoA synthetase (AMP-forming)/AMP-acid ligase II
MAINLSDDVNINIESVGRPLKHVNACIKEEDGNNLIYIKSPGIAIGYVGQDEFSRDYYQTGDIGEIDENGFIYIRGRVKRLINTAGLKVNPAEVEEVLQSHPKVAEVTVKGRPDSDFGEIVEAIIVSSDKTLSEQEVIDYCRKSVAAFKVPKIITFVDSLKKSGTGKAII